MLWFVRKLRIRTSGEEIECSGRQGARRENEDKHTPLIKNTEGHLPEVDAAELLLARWISAFGTVRDENQESERVVTRTCPRRATRRAGIAH